MAEFKKAHARYVYVIPCGMTITGVDGHAYRDFVNHRAYCPRCKETKDFNPIDVYKDGRILRVGGASFRPVSEYEGLTITRVGFEDGFIPPKPAIDKIIYGPLVREGGGFSRLAPDV